jgi:hypothetical protein
MLQDLFQIAGTATTVNAGNVDAGTQRVVLASDQASVTVDAPTGTPVNVQIGDGTDQVTVTAGGELNVIATAQAGVDIGDVTVNNAAGGGAVNIQDGGNSITVDNVALSVVGGGTEAAALRVTIANNSTGLLSVDDNSGSLTVDAPTGTPVNVQIGDGVDQVLVTGSGELNVIATAQAGVDIGDVTVNNAGAGAAVNIQDGGNSITVDAPVGTPANVQISDGTDTVTVTAGGELNVIATAQAGVDIGDVTVNNTAGASAVFVQGQAAHDAAVAGNPVVIAGRSNANEPAAVSADNEAVFAWMDRFGRQITVAGHPSPETPNSTNVTADGNTELIATPGGGLSLYIKKGSVHNAAPTAKTVQLKDGAAGAVVWQAELASSGGGSLFNFGDVGWKLTAATALNANLSGSGDVDFNITEYYISA